LSVTAANAAVDSANTSAMVSINAMNFFMILLPVDCKIFLFIPNDWGKYSLHPQVKSKMIVF
ncbi:MAG: hypothetical protein LUE21_02325, partial [Oscillospiraceae bacterium]|nr:hypothetical protein [Oscillospiraceae bacterium]